MSKFVFGTALAVLAAAIPATAPAQKVGAAVIVTVDRERIYRECTACKAAQAQLQAQLTSLQTRAQQLGQPIQTEAQSLDAALKALAGKQPDAAMTARITAFQAKQNSANQELQSREQGIRSSQAHVLQQVDAKLEPIYAQVMNTRGANLALDENATLAHGASIDVTNDVLALLNQQLPSVSVTPLQQQQQQQQQQTQQPAGR